MAETDDFGDTTNLQDMRDSTQHLDVDLGDLLVELENINVHQASIENALIVTDLPLRYRSGTPLFMCDFEYGDGHWKATTAGTGATSASSTTLWYSKGKSWELKAGSDGAKYARAEARFGNYPLGAVGVECAFTLADNMTALHILFKIVSGDDYYLADIYYNQADDKFKLRDENYAVQTILEGWTPDLGDNAFHFLKLVVDSSTGLYTTLFLDEHEIDISAYGLFTTTGATGDPMYIAFQLGAVSGNNPIVYIDDVCLTEED